MTAATLTDQERIEKLERQVQWMSTLLAALGAQLIAGLPSPGPDPE